MAPVHGLGCVFARENFYQLRETNFKIGLCGENRTPDPMLPKQVRYQLRYTRRKLEKPAPGGGTRARTADNPVKSRVLYRLSYAP